MDMDALSDKDWQDLMVGFDVADKPSVVLRVQRLRAAGFDLTRPAWIAAERARVQRYLDRVHSVIRGA
jgi:hypothetical protein